MKYIDEGSVVELTARNVAALLAKLDDQSSTRMLVAPTGDVVVQAVEDDTVRGNDTAIRAVESDRIVVLTRDELWRLATPGTTVMVTGFTVRSVPNESHYRDRAPGVVYMPESRISW